MFHSGGRAKPSSFLSSAFSPLKQKTLAYYAGSDFTRTSTRAIYLVAAAFLQGQQRQAFHRAGKYIQDQYRFMIWWYDMIQWYDSLIWDTVIWMIWKWNGRYHWSIWYHRYHSSFSTAGCFSLVGSGTFQLTSTQKKRQTSWTQMRCVLEVKLFQKRSIAAAWLLENTTTATFGKIEIWKQTAN